jgi:hypothetical protein
MSAAPRCKVFDFGPNNRLTGAITDPPRAPPTIGAVIAGMGVAELRVARALASFGIVTLQFREREASADWIGMLNERGVSNFKEAMGYLRAERGLQRFICMGNCGRGSIAFRVALEDPSVIGLVLSNPHISPALTIRESYANRLMSPSSWKQLLAGKANLRYHLANSRLLAMSLLRRVARISEQKLIDESGHNKDATMPDRFEERVGQLVRRGVKILMAFSENDVGLTYFRKLYGASFEGLVKVPGLSIDLLPTLTHIPSHDTAAANALVNMVNRWAHDSGFAPSTPTRPRSASPPPRRFDRSARAT